MTPRVITPINGVITPINGVITPINGVITCNKWYYKWVTGFITPISGVVTLLVSARGPPCNQRNQWKCNKRKQCKQVMRHIILKFISATKRTFTWTMEDKAGEVLCLGVNGHGQVGIENAGAMLHVVDIFCHFFESNFSV